MRSISNFPTGQNRKRGRRIPNHNNTSNANGNNGLNQPGPVWGRSAAAVVAISSSPSNSSYRSSGSSNGSDRSLSMSPVPPSPIWGRSARVSVAANKSPRQTRNAMKEVHYQQQQGVMTNRSRSPSPHSPVLVDDYRDEVTTSTPSHPLRHQQQQVLLVPLTASSSPRLSHDLCTIAEDRKISSNTLSQMAITSTADEIAKSPVLVKRRPQQHRQQPQHDYPMQSQQSASPKFHDPYNDDSFDDSRDQECADCWAYQKFRFQNCWPFGKHSEASRNSNSNNNNNKMSRQMKEISKSPRRSRTAGFPAVHRRVHVRRTSF